MAAAALLATTLGVALAQSGQAPLPKTLMNQGMDDHGGSMDMSKMNRMMDNCNRMMEESMQQHPRSEPGTTTPDKG